MLHARQKRLEALAEAEAAGESFWTKTFDKRTRVRIEAVWADLSRNDYLLLNFEGTPGERIERRIQEELGEVVISIGSFLRSAMDDVMPSVLQAIAQERDAHWAERVNRILLEERIAFELVDGNIVEFDSRELHVEVVAPAIRLLSGRDGWEDVESSYLKALTEIGTDPSDAITDVGTALQAALALLGCSGNALGPLIKSARQKGLLAPHDENLADGIQKILDWVSADRSTTGDAHGVTGASPDDAWFAVHVVGALILRLAGDPRG
jgi:hypothetical protein